MSRWTHIKGALELSATPYEVKPNKLVKPERANFNSEEEWRDAYFDWRRKIHKYYYLPYPEEQFKITTPRMLTRFRKPTKKDPSETETVLHVDEAFVYSLPRAKKYLDEAFALLPEGEVGFRYAAKQDCYDYSSSTWSSEFEFPCLKEYYKKALEKLYYNEGHWSRYTFDDLRKYQKIDPACSVADVNDIIIGIREDLRYCSADEMQEGLEKFFKYLEEKEISINDGYLEWEDEWDEGYIYCWRYNRRDWKYSHQFLKLDAKTNAIVHSKTWVYKLDEDGYPDNTQECDIVEKDGPYSD